MKKNIRPILSLLLALAMLLPMAGTARAAALTLSPAAVTLYYPVSHRKNTAAVSVTGSTDAATAWTMSAGSAVLVTTPGVSTTLTLASDPTAAVPDATLTATASNGDAGSVTVKVVRDTLTAAPATVTASPAASFTVGTQATLSTAVHYASGYTAAPIAVTYAPLDPTVVNVIGNVMTGLKVGSTTVTATATGDDGAVQTGSLTVTVSAPAVFSVTGSAETGVPYQFNNPAVANSIYAQISQRWYALYPTVPLTAVTGTLTPDPAGAVYGTLYNGNGIPVTGAVSCTLTDLADMYFVPMYATAGAGYGCSFYFADASGHTLNGTIQIAVTTPTKNVIIPISSASDYSFSAASTDSAGRSAAAILSETIGAYGSIVFGKPTTAVANIGVLYAASPYGVSYLNAYEASGKTVEASQVGGMYFIPTPGVSGIYTIPYSAYSGASGTGSLVSSGSLSISVDGGTLNVSVTLDSVTPYVFSATPASTLVSGTSAYSQFTSALTGLGLGGGSYLQFSAPSAASSAVGTLYRNSASLALTPSTPVNYAEIANLYFVPNQLGTYESTYSVYTGNVLVATGTLTINVNNVLGDPAFSYTTTFGETVSLLESDFAAFLRDKAGVSCTLTDVIFNDYSGGGTFYYGASAFIPRSGGTAYYSRSYAGTVTASARYLDTVSFKAPANSAGFTAVSFTAYGTNARGVSISERGVFHIYYSAARIPDIEYNAYSAYGTGLSAVKLDEAKFLSAYQAAMGTASANAQFFIRLQSLPAYGRLFQNYTSSFATGTQLTNANYSSSSFYIGRSTAGSSVSTLTYEPIVGYGALTGSSYILMDTVKYTAYNVGGTPLFTGTIRFKLAPDRTETVSSDGLHFSYSSFYDTAAVDPVLYVTFDKPAAGKLYVFINSQPIEVTPAMKLYTINPADGDRPIDLTYYVPQVGSSTPVTLSYTAHTKNGGSYSGSVVANPTVKRTSTQFSDVTGVTGSWAADSVDFASMHNLVKGSGEGKFSPDSKMRRCDLVLILYRMAGSPAVYGTLPYTDVPAGTDSYSKEIYSSALWASQKGIVDGLVSNGQYLPASNVTRQEYIRILYNFAKSNGVNVASSGSYANYTDASRVAAYAVEAMRWSVANSYITSTDSSRLVLSPEREATRAEIVTLLHRYLTY